MRKRVDGLGDLPEADQVAVSDVSDGGDALVRKQVMRTHRMEIELRHDHQLAFLRCRHERALQHLDRVLAVAVEQVFHPRLGDALWGAARLRVQLRARRE